MTVRAILEMYDNWNTTVVVNDNNLREIARGKGYEIYDNNDLVNLPVSSFGFYDGEFCIRVGVNVDVTEV